MSFIPQVVHCHKVNCTESRVKVACGTNNSTQKAACCDCSHSSFAKHRKTIAAKSKKSPKVQPLVRNGEDNHHHHLRMQDSLLGNMVFEDGASDSEDSIPLDLIFFAGHNQSEVAGIRLSIQINSANPPLLVLPLRI